MREKLDFDKDWYFHRGDIDYADYTNKGAMYMSAKTERKHIGPASRSYYLNVDSFEENVEYKTERWEKVELPHDYVIRGERKATNNNALGFFDYDDGWYVKRFKLDAFDKDKRITLYFEGVATHTTVYLNGCLMKHSFCGYVPFEVDITDVVKFGEENVLSVYVSTKEHEGWWYEGGGIYRHVWLEKTDLLSVDRYGVFVKPIRTTNGWVVKTETTVRNDGLKNRSVKIISEIISPRGEVVAESSAGGSVELKETRTFPGEYRPIQPQLWSPESPVLYTLRTKIYTGGRQTDEYDTRFGFRFVKFDAKKGLFINDKPYKIKGVCGHADTGLLGKAVPDNVHAYKVRLLKEMGANGYRTSHYPQAEALMDALDENGFIVMDETRWFESTDEGRAQLETLVKRDRNRPSVMMWSVGNEEPHHVTDEGRRIFRSLKALVKKLDDTRPVMTAVSYSPDKATVYEDCDILGINYNWEIYDNVHEKYPDKCLFASECCATGTTRGWYADDDPTRAFVSAYDHDSSSGFRSREFTWKFLTEREWLLGGYQWIAFEHLGEAVWPRICSQSGAVDAYLQKKDAFYQNKSHWSDEPMVHLLPHWNHAGLEGEVIPVWAYTNMPKVELFLNGESLGEREVERYGHAEWLVPYSPGRLTVKAYDERGKEYASDERVTSKAPYALKLTNDVGKVRANGKDVAIISCYVVDEDGNEVPDAALKVEFSCNSLGRIVSCGSDITDHESIFRPHCVMRAGRAALAVAAGTKKGELKVYACAQGLRRGSVRIILTED